MSDQPADAPQDPPLPDQPPQTQPAPLPDVPLPATGEQAVPEEADELARRLVQDVTAYEVDPPPPAR